MATALGVNLSSTLPTKNPYQPNITLDAPHYSILQDGDSQAPRKISCLRACEITHPLVAFTHRDLRDSVLIEAPRFRDSLSPRQRLTVSSITAQVTLQPRSSTYFLLQKKNSRTIISILAHIHCASTQLYPCSTLTSPSPRCLPRKPQLPRPTPVTTPVTRYAEPPLTKHARMLISPVQLDRRERAQGTSICAPSLPRPRLTNHPSQLLLLMVGTTSFSKEDTERIAEHVFKGACHCPPQHLHSHSHSHSHR